jgi:hypothetical protein
MHNNANCHNNNNNNNNNDDDNSNNDDDNSNEGTCDFVMHALFQRPLQR